MNDRRARPTLIRRAVDAATRPVHLVPPGVGITAAGSLLALGQAPLAVVVGGLSMLTWGAMVAWDLATPPAPPEPEPPPPGLDAPHLQKALDAVRAAAASVREPIDAHDGVLGASLLEIRVAADGLVDSAEGLARRGDAVYRYLRTYDPAEIQREADQLARASQGARDAETAASLASAAEAKRKQLATWKELRAQHDRIEAELIAVEAELDSLHARVVHLTLNDPGDTSAGASIGRELASLGTRMSMLEKAAAATLSEVS